LVGESAFKFDLQYAKCQSSYSLLSQYTDGEVKIKVKLPLFLIKHHVMKMCGGTSLLLRSNERQCAAVGEKTVLNMYKICK
jgi:hypothetical protein